MITLTFLIVFTWTPSHAINSNVDRHGTPLILAYCAVIIAGIVNQLEMIRCFYHFDYSACSATKPPEGDLEGAVVPKNGDVNSSKNTKKSKMLLCCATTTEEQNIDVEFLKAIGEKENTEEKVRQKTQNKGTKEVAEVTENNKDVAVDLDVIKVQIDDSEDRKGEKEK